MIGAWGNDEVTGLALSAGHGDELALAEFIRATQSDVWRFCAHLGGSVRADDLTQETYLRAVRSLPGFRGESSARTWLLAIARRAVADALRSESRRRNRLPESGEEAVEAAPGGFVELNMMLDRLDPDRRAALVLTQVLGYSYAEAAEVCGCPIGTVRSRVARGRRDLLDALGGERDGRLRGRGRRAKLN